MFALGDPQESAGLLAGIVYQPYYLGTFLLAGADRVERAADVGLDANADAAEGGGDHRGLRAVGGRAGHAVLQPVHLFLFLMSTPEQPLPAGGPGREEARAHRDRAHDRLAVHRAAADGILPDRDRRWCRSPRWPIARVRRRREHRGRLVSPRPAFPARSGSYLAQAGGLEARGERIVSANRIALTGLSGFERALENESLHRADAAAAGAAS